MNIQRYIMPVIIAASLHTALVFFFSDNKSPTIRLKPDKPVILQEIPVVAAVPEEPDTSAAGDSGGASELPPSIPDIPRELPKEDIFRIDVKQRMESIKPVAGLPKIPEGIGGLGEGEGP